MSKVTRVVVCGAPRGLNWRRLAGPRQHCTNMPGSLQRRQERRQCSRVVPQLTSRAPSHAPVHILLMPCMLVTVPLGSLRTGDTLAAFRSSRGQARPSTRRPKWQLRGLWTRCKWQSLESRGRRARALGVGTSGCTSHSPRAASAARGAFSSVRAALGGRVSGLLRCWRVPEACGTCGRREIVRRLSVTVKLKSFVFGLTVAATCL